MTASREASIRLSVDGRQAEAALGQFKRSAMTMGNALQQQFSTLGSQIGTLSGLAGGFTFVGLTKGAIDARKQLDNLQFSIRAGTGVLMDFNRIQASAMQSSERWGFGISKLTATMQQLFDASGDPEFMSKAVDQVAIAARATGAELSYLGSLAGDLNEKFGVSAEGIQSALATVYSLGKQGGLQFEEMGSYITRIGAAARGAGIQGEEGLRRVLGLANFASDALGGRRQALQAVTQLVQGVSAGDLQRPASKLGIDVKGMVKKGNTFEDVITEIVAKSGGDRTKLQETFGRDTGNVLSELGDMFKEAGGGAAGRAKLKSAFEELARSALTAGEMQKQAAENMEKAPAKIEAAMAALERAMQSDQVAERISQFASKLPAAADALGKFIKFAADEPGVAAVGAAAGHLAIQRAEIGLLVASGFMLKDQIDKVEKDAKTEVYGADGAPMSRPRIARRRPTNGALEWMAQRMLKQDAQYEVDPDRMNETPDPMRDMIIYVDKDGVERVQSSAEYMQSDHAKRSVMRTEEVQEDGYTIRRKRIGGMPQINEGLWGYGKSGEDNYPLAVLGRSLLERAGQVRSAQAEFSMVPFSVVPPQAFGPLRDGFEPFPGRRQPAAQQRDDSSTRLMDMLRARFGEKQNTVRIDNNQVLRVQIVDGPPVPLPGQ